MKATKAAEEAQALAGTVVLATGGAGLLEAPPPLLLLPPPPQPPSATKATINSAGRPRQNRKFIFIMHLNC